MSLAIKKASVVAFYNQPEGVKQSVRKLKKCGFDIKNLSIAGKGYRPSASLFMVSGLGPIAVSGSLVEAIISIFGQGIFSRSPGALHAGLCKIGVPKENIFQCVSALKNGLFLVCARGPVDKMIEVKRVLVLSKANEVTVHYQ